MVEQRTSNPRVAGSIPAQVIVKEKTLKLTKKYNEMLHSLAYKQFVDSIEQCGYRHLVYTKRVNPAWTSRLAKQNYCQTMKLNSHIGASYVIARRGQGYTET